MLERIPRQPPELVSGHVPLFEGGITVCILVGDHREKQDGRDENELLNGVQRGGGDWKRAGDSKQVGVGR